MSEENLRCPTCGKKTIYTKKDGTKRCVNGHKWQETEQDGTASIITTA